jgi:hypothetical protein
MPTWTCNNFKGHYPVGVGAVVVAENIEEAIKILETQLYQIGLKQVIKPEQLIPLPTYNSYVLILTDGMY